MAGIFGDLALEDEWMHPIEADSQFNESMLVTYFDHRSDSGALLRIGNRPNEGYAEVTFCVFPPEGGALFQFSRAPISSNDAFDAGGMRFEVTKPAEVMVLSYQGNVAYFADPLALSDPGPAFREAPRRSVQLAVEGTALSPMYGARSGTSVGGHYEQHMKMTGSMVIDGQSVPVTGIGNRDHSWGPRNWHRTYQDRTLWCTFDSSLSFAVSLTWSEPNAPVEVMGTVIVDGEARRLVDGKIDSEFDDNGLYHRGFDCEVVDDQGDRYQFRGEVMRFIPFRHRRDGHITHIGQGMTKFTHRDKVSYGLSEYMDLVQ